ncbi:Centrosomal spindle body, CEP44-domain-containing protein [Gorgonomyces haynaldii]|nr:Centrosomal spindle body, CEP44-domain-containing protein [Gorgonomyces haynaldii]
MATGDLRNNMMKLQQGLKSVKISKGDPSAFLPLIHHVLLESPTLSKYFTSKEYDLYGKKDARFLETVYQLLRDEFHYKPALTQTQFLSTGFSERKCILVSDIIKHARELEMDLQRKRGRKDRTPESSPGETRNNSGESVDHIPKQILDNPPSRFLSEQAWLQHVQRSLNGMEPILNYPKPLEHPLGDMEDSLFENRSSNLDSEPISLEHLLDRISALEHDMLQLKQENQELKQSLIKERELWQLKDLELNKLREQELKNVELRCLKEQDPIKVVSKETHQETDPKVQWLRKVHSRTD